MPSFRRIFLDATVLLALLLGLFFNRGQFEFTDVRLIAQGGRSEPVVLPYIADGREGQYFDFVGTLHWKPPAPTLVRIIADDCVWSFSLNDHELSGADVPEGNSCDYTNGMLIELGKHLKEGENRFAIRIENRGGQLGLRFVRSNMDLLTTPTGILVTFLGLYLLFRFSRQIRLPRAEALLIVGGAALRLFYLAHTGPGERTYDVFEPGGHYDYIRYLRNHLTLPSPLEGWEYHQPPLYYAAAALFQFLTLTRGTLAELFTLQLFSLLLSTVFLIFALRIYHFVLERPEIRVLTSALTVFWPSGVIHSVRIGNDTLVHCLSAVVIYYVVRWQREGTKRNFFFAVIGASLAMLTKSNGLAMVLLLAAMFCRTFYRDPIKRRGLARMAAPAFVLLFTTSVMGFWPKFAASAGGQSVWLVGATAKTLNPELYIDTSAPSYFTFNPESFVHVPYVNSWKDESGRQFFWNYFLKSSLFGEFAFDTPKQNTLAVMLSVILLGLLIFLVASLPALTSGDFAELLPFFLSFGLILSAAIAFPLITPISSAADFRYSYALVIVCCAIFGRELEGLRGAMRAIPGTAAVAGVALGWGFVCCSVIFFVSAISW